jgi:hypothetical protein
MNTSKALLTGAFALLTLLPAAAGTYVSSGKTAAPPPPPPPEPCAGPISYSNIELLYTYTDFDDDFGDHANGGRLALEWALAERWYLALGVNFMDGDNVDLWVINGGVGVSIPFTEHIHGVLEGGALWSDLDFDENILNDDLDDNSGEWGWYVKPHIRGKWGCFEAHVGALFREMDDVGDSDGRWAGFGKIYYHLNNSWDVTVGVLFEEDTTEYSGGIRWRF